MPVTGESGGDLRPLVTLVAAVAENGVIGREGTLPWHLPDEFRHFKRLTTGHTVIMGRKTFEELGSALRDRRNIVISRNPSFTPEEVEVAESVAEALRLAEGDEEVFVVGGAQIYARALPLADRMVLTEVHARPEGDTWFPDWNPAEWRVVSEERHEADERNAHAFTIRRYARASA